MTLQGFREVISLHICPSLLLETVCNRLKFYVIDSELKLVLWDKRLKIKELTGPLGSGTMSLPGEYKSR